MEPAIVERWWRDGALPVPAGAHVTIAGRDPVLGARHRVGEAAAAASALLGAWAARIHERRGGPPQAVRVDVSAAAASLLGFVLQRCPGTSLERMHHPVTGIYRTADARWIHLHGGFPHLAQGALDLLGASATRASIADAVARWPGFALEDEMARRRLCAAVVRTADEWHEHPQGRAVAALPAVTITRLGDAPPRPRAVGARPLEGVRVADLTRVLAGPSCGRALAAHGADVVRIASPRLPSIEPFVVETGHGKRSAFADLDDARDRARLDDFLDGADVVTQSYRHGALARRGLGAADLAARRPGIVYVSIGCHGHTGPWASRGGWEQLAQSVSGICHDEAKDGVPAVIPAAATDYTTGCLAAVGTLAALDRQMSEGGSWLVEASLCQTARWIRRTGVDLDPAAACGIGEPAMATVDTAWGALTHLLPVERLERTPARWDRPPEPLGASPLAWLPRPA